MPNLTSLTLADNAFQYRKNLVVRSRTLPFRLQLDAGAFDFLFSDS